MTIAQRTARGCQVIRRSPCKRKVPAAHTKAITPVCTSATITNAYIQFTVDEVSTGYALINIFGEDTNDSGTIYGNNGNLSSRATTAAEVFWTPADWNTVGEAGLKQRTPDLSAIIQEIVNRPGWMADDMLILMDGDATRTAESFEGDPAKAPMLHVEWQ